MKTMKEAWEEYKLYFVPNKTSEEELENYREAFYMGAWRSFVIFKSLYEDEGPDELANNFSTLYKEFDEYLGRVSKRRSAI